jgi:hypothetical protein
MALTKVLDSSAAYSPIDTIWWSHNDINYNTWNKKQIIVNEKEWEHFIKKHFSNIQTNYTFISSKSPFELNTWNGASIIAGNKNELFISWELVLKTKDELTISVSLSWHKRLDSYVNELVEKINSMIVHSSDKTSVYMIIQDDSGLDLRSFDIDIPQLDIELNYGKDWAEKHDYLLKALSKDTKKGIALLHGLPGTGKSMYIRYLISLLSETRTMIYLPNQLINSLTNPSFIPLMADYPNSILIIEDAEEAIKSRKSGGTTVDKILNLSDGIISDFLGTQIICTFNSDVTIIDEALLRKGRLILKHEFKKLSVQDSQKLSDALGKNIKVDKEMTISDIYNAEEKYSGEPTHANKIGF